MASVQTRVVQRESDPDFWAVEYRESDHESWDTLPARFSVQWKADLAAQELAQSMLADIRVEESENRQPTLATERLAKNLCDAAGIKDWVSLARAFQDAWIKHREAANA